MHKYPCHRVSVIIIWIFKLRLLKIIPSPLQILTVLQVALQRQLEIKPETPWVLLSISEMDLFVSYIFIIPHIQVYHKKAVAFFTSFIGKRLFLSPILVMTIQQTIFQAKTQFEIQAITPAQQNKIQKLLGLLAVYWQKEKI